MNSENINEQKPAPKVGVFGYILLAIPILWIVSSLATSIIYMDIYDLTYQELYEDKNYQSILIFIMLISQLIILFTIAIEVDRLKREMSEEKRLLQSFSLITLLFYIIALPIAYFMYLSKRQYYNRKNILKEGIISVLLAFILYIVGFGFIEFQQDIKEQGLETNLEYQSKDEVANNIVKTKKSTKQEDYVTYGLYQGYDYSDLIFAEFKINEELQAFSCLKEEELDKLKKDVYEITYYKHTIKNFEFSGDDYSYNCIKSLKKVTNDEKMSYRKALLGEYQVGDKVILSGRMRHLDSDNIAYIYINNEAFLGYIDGITVIEFDHKPRLADQDIIYAVGTFAGYSTDKGYPWVDVQYYGVLKEGYK